MIVSEAEGNDTVYWAEIGFIEHGDLGIDHHEERFTGGVIREVGRLGAVDTLSASKKSNMHK
jgi:hypothetical protein